MYELPYSGMIDMRDLWVETNYNALGIYVFRVAQNEDAEEPIVPAGLLGVDEDSLALCPGPFEPRVAPTLTNDGVFTITDCPLPSHDEIQVLFVSQLITLQAPEVTFNATSAILRGTLPEFFTEDNRVSVRIILDKVLLGLQKTLAFAALSDSQNKMTCTFPADSPVLCTLESGQSQSVRATLTSFTGWYPSSARLDTFQVNHLAQHFLERKTQEVMIPVADGATSFEFTPTQTTANFVTMHVASDGNG